MKVANQPMELDPVEKALKDGPCGKADWNGWSEVYNRINFACQKMGQDKYTRLSDNHVDTMADLGSGHEGRMKARLHWLYTYGYLNDYKS